MDAEIKYSCEIAEIIYEKPLSGAFDELMFGSDRENSLWVKFSDKDGITEWIGKFGTGTSSAARVAKAISPDKFLVVAGGHSYLVDATNRLLLNEYHTYSIQDAVFDPIKECLVVADWVRLRVIKSGQEIWASKRIALDGIRNLKVEGRILSGVATVGYADEEETFTFDLDSWVIKCPVDFSSWETKLRS